MTKWTEKEETWLVDNWENMTIRRLADELDRSYDSVRKKARRMNLSKKEQQHSNVWTEDEIEELKENYSTSTDTELAELFDDRSLKSTKRKARELGLVRFSTDPIEMEENKFRNIHTKIDTDDDKMVLVPMGDLHLGHPACDEELAFDTLEYLENMDNDYRLLLMGDLWEGGTKGSPNFQFRMKYPPQKQYTNAIAMFEDHSDKILGALVGNHEDFAKSVTGVEKMRDFCRELEIPFLKYKGAVNIELNGIYYQIIATHGSSGARTWGGRINALVRLNNVMPDADLFLYGHTHSRASVTDSKYSSMGENSKKSKRTYCLTGSFMDYPGTYADKKNYPPTCLGVIPCELSTKKKKITARV